MGGDLSRVLIDCDVPEACTLELQSPLGVDRILAISMPADRSFERWQEIDSKAAALGYVALGIGSARNITGIREHLAHVSAEFDLASELADAESIDIDAWFRSREENLLEDEHEIPYGEWADPGGNPGQGLWFPFENGKHLDPWWLALVPAKLRWNAPLALAYGGWNDCPAPSEHAAICSYWEKKYRAKLVAVGPDTMEFKVESPPMDKQAALALAKEHYLYCSDIVEQGTGNIAALAGFLLRGGTWSFWWD